MLDWEIWDVPSNRSEGTLLTPEHAVRPTVSQCQNHVARHRTVNDRTVRAPPVRFPEGTAVRESKVTVKIPRPLYRKIQQVVDGSGFNSPTDFIVYVLRDLMGEAEEHEQEFTQDELDDVKRKLKNLGYL